MTSIQQGPLNVHIKKHVKKLEEDLKNFIEDYEINGVDNDFRYMMSGADSSFMKANAITKILSEREGKKYTNRVVYEAMGIREPDTLKEKIKYFFTGAYPKIKN